MYIITSKKCVFLNFFPKKYIFLCSCVFTYDECGRAYGFYGDESRLSLISTAGNLFYTVTIPSLVVMYGLSKRGFSCIVYKSRLDHLIFYITFMRFRKKNYAVLYTFIQILFKCPLFECML